MSPLSADLLHQVLLFFVSKTKVVDGESLRSSSLVCKQWREAVNLKSLWAIPSSGDLGGNDKNKTQEWSVYGSLQIKEADDSDSSLQESLVGFIKLRFFGKELGFLVRERATEEDWLICIAIDGHKSPRLIRQLYADHFELNERFLNFDTSSSTSLSYQPYPSGICVWKGRVVLWYRPSVFCDYSHETESDWLKLQEARFRHFCRPIGEPILHNHDWTNMSCQAVALVRHQFRLENCCRAERSGNRRIPLNSWATIVDWVVEVAECFDLDDKTVFQAMALLDQFVGSNVQEVSHRHYQLLAGSSLLLASKCNKVFLTCKDICFCADNSFSVDNVEATEELVLEQLEWKLAYPTSMDFLFAYARVLNMDENGREFVMWSYINELSLQSGAYFIYPPSVIGASSMVLGRYCLQAFSPGITLWPEALIDASGLTLNALAACTVQLSRDLADMRMAMPDLTMIRRRHSKSSRHCVAEVDIPVLPSSRVVLAYEERLRS